ncbi:MAG: hypothetical protein RLZZ244_997 [Verrucomicrobiota bacterium]|jgi:dihydropteroate synthase
MLDLLSLSRLLERHAHCLDAKVQSFELRGIPFTPWPQVALMGVVNLSADSWYRESVVLNPEAAIRRGRRLATEGARLIDLGAESTLLHAQRISPAEQAARLTPVIQALCAHEILVSVESYHIELTQHCLAAGAAVVNLTAGRHTEPFYRAAAEHEAGVILCYIQEADNARDAGDFRLHTDHTSILLRYFEREIQRAVDCGVKRLWIDPGLGFYYKNLTDSAQRVRYQIETFLNAFRLRTLGWPVCQALPHAFEFFEEEVRSAEPFFGMLALLARTDLLRTHEVAKLRGVVGSMGVIA